MYKRVPKALAGTVVSEVARRKEVEDRLDAMEARLMTMQPVLGGLIKKADVLFEEVFFRAPHPSWVTDRRVTAIASANYDPVAIQPFSRSTFVKYATGKVVEVNKLFVSYSPDPITQLTTYRPDGEYSRKVLILGGDPKDVQVSHWDTTTSTHKGFIGWGYLDHEEDLEKAEEALDDARQFAAETLDYDVGNLPELRASKDQITLELARVNPRPSFFNVTV